MFLLNCMAGTQVGKAGEEAANASAKFATGFAQYAATNLLTVILRVQADIDKANIVMFKVFTSQHTRYVPLRLWRGRLSELAVLPTYALRAGIIHF